MGSVATTMHAARVIGVATGAYLAQGPKEATQNTRLPLPDFNSKNKLNLHPLFIVGAGGSRGPLTTILCVDLGSPTLLLNPLVTSTSVGSPNCYLVPLNSYEGVAMMTAMAISEV